MNAPRFPASLLPIASAEGAARSGEGRAGGNGWRPIMTVNCLPSSEAAARALAEDIIAEIHRKPDAVLGLATGATMEPVYAELVRRFRKGDVSFARVTTFNLDEYVGLSGQDPRSYRGTMDSQLFDLVDIDKSRTHLPNGMAADLEAEVIDYERQIKAAGGVDFQILGIGRNGHIGFNEPGTPFASRTHVETLHSETLAANAGFFANDVPPSRALTMGIATILSARRIAILATGDSKRDAVAAALSGPVDPACPASALSVHAAVTWWLDPAASAGLDLANAC